jgi:hypothetical protein
MIKSNFTIFIMILLSSYSIAQKENKSMKVLSLKETKEINERIIDYSTSINIADSLYKSYIDSAFFIETQNSKLVESGLTYILRLYETAAKYGQNKEYCDEQLQKIHTQIDEQIRSENKANYNKIITKAEEYYSNGNIEKSIELYERAIRLKPSDDNAKKRLKELNKIKNKRK